MRVSRSGLWTVACLGLLCGGLAAADRINVLIIDGQNNHNWQSTTPVIKEMLLKTERFNVEVATTPPKGTKDKALWEKFRPEFTKYGAVVSNYNGEEWPAEVKTAFEKYMNDGGGLVAIHAANNSFGGWQAWRAMIGLGWWDAKTGDRITLEDDGKLVRTPKGQGIGPGHGPQWPYELTVREATHPVLEGMPAKWKHAQDELYQGQRGPAQDMHILVSAFADKEKKGSGTNEPMVWWIPVGKGRSFVTLLGHDAKSIAHPGSVDMICRGTEWVATGKVTIPASLKP